MFPTVRCRRLLLPALASCIVSAGFSTGLSQTAKEKDLTALEWQVPNEKAMLPFKDQKPIQFVVGSPFVPEWSKLTGFWNEFEEKAVDPATGKEVVRKVVKIKVPLGLTQAPPVPPENPMTYQKWLLGKQLFFDGVLCSDGSVSCASCHDPKTGYTTPTKTATGIGGQLGGMNGPTVLNSAYNLLQFWDGRASSLEDQCQGPPQNPVEMFDGKGHAWHLLVQRVRAKGDYSKRFLEAFGTEPTRDSIAKAIAAYERTVLIGNSIHDRADIAMKHRVLDEGSTKLEITAKDYETALNAAVNAKDQNALQALGLDPAKDAAKVPALAAQINNGRILFFNKARCNGCHVGDNFTDNQFHNLGVGVVKGQLPADALGRFGSQPTGHKNPALIGAFKTPPLRGLLSTGPYMHDGSEATLEKVVDFYDKGGNANEFLDIRMRDEAAEKAYLLNKDSKGPAVQLFGKDQKPIIPLPLKLTDQEKKDLVLFMKALQSDPVDPIVADPNRK
ncbi:MAG: cytochrome C peroxidase [Planctomycetia bacterium]|nr:cytochrome C peroxidase [Planctomycetia bacterium]